MNSGDNSTHIRQDVDTIINISYDETSMGSQTNIIPNEEK